MCIKGIEGVTFCHCPYCKAGLIIVNNKVESCPVCELRREKAGGAKIKAELKLVQVLI